MVASYTSVLQILPKFLENSNQTYIRKRIREPEIQLNQTDNEQPEKDSTSWSYEDNSYNIVCVVQLSDIDENNPNADLNKT